MSDRFNPLNLTPQEAENLRYAAEAEGLERNLYGFLKAAWPQIVPAPFLGGWAIEAICEHLEAVTNGEIKRLLVNIPPRSSKTTTISICWPVWIWSRRKSKDNPLVGPGVTWLFGSYSARKAQEDGVTARRLIGTKWYQQRWGKRYQITEDRDNQERYDTTAGGSRISTGIAESLGKGGLIRVLDDPHKTEEAESIEVRNKVIRAYKEVWTTRSNDFVGGAEVIIMQRLAADDLSGHVLDSDEDWVHLCIPARFEERRRCTTVLGWSDPRTEEGESFQPERFPEEVLDSLEEKAGPYAWSSQYQQSPTPRGGGIVKEEWWQVWPPDGEEDAWEYVAEVDGRKKVILNYPDPQLVILATDGAFTEKEGNDWCATTVWYVFTGSYGQLPTSDAMLTPKILLAEAWRARLELPEYARKLLDTIRRRQVDRALIENRASGYPVAQELRRLLRTAECIVETVDPGNISKSARLHGTVPLFAAGQVFAPKRRWADLVIRETAEVPNGKHDDLADTVSIAVGWLRRHGVAMLAAEAKDRDYQSKVFRGRKVTVAQAYGVG